MKWGLEDLGVFAGHKQLIIQTKGSFLLCCLRKGEAGAETAAEQAGLTSTASQQHEQSRSSCLLPGRQACRDGAGRNPSQGAKPACQGQNSHLWGIWAGIAGKLLWQGPRLLCNMLNSSCQNTQGEKNQIYCFVSFVLVGQHNRHLTFVRVGSSYPFFHEYTERHLLYYFTDKCFSFLTWHWRHFIHESMKSQCPCCDILALSNNMPVLYLHVRKRSFFPKGRRILLNICIMSSAAPAVASYTERATLKCKDPFWKWSVSCQLLNEVQCKNNPSHDHGDKLMILCQSGVCCPHLTSLTRYILRFVLSEFSEACSSRSLIYTVAALESTEGFMLPGMWDQSCNYSPLAGKPLLGLSCIRNRPSFLKLSKTMRSMKIAPSCEDEDCTISWGGNCAGAHVSTEGRWSLSQCIKGSPLWSQSDFQGHIWNQSASRWFSPERFPIRFLLRVLHPAFCFILENSKELLSDSPPSFL